MNEVFVNIITLIPLSLIIFLILFDKSSLRRISTEHFLRALIFTALLSICEIILSLNYNSAEPSLILSQITRATSLSLTSIVGYNLVAMEIFNTNLEKYKEILKLPIIINMLLSVTSIWTGLFFSISPANEYIRGPLFILHLLLNITYGIFSIIIILANARKSQLDDMVCFIVNFLLMGIVLCFQLLHNHLHLIWSTVSVHLMFYYITQLTHNLRHDTLTNLYNRHMYESDLTRFDNKKCVTIINIDVNDFKYINDSLGHEQGDKILQYAAQVLNKHFSPYGFTYRIGGDEFCIILDKYLPVEIATIFQTIEEELLPEKKIVGIPKLFSYGYFMHIPMEGKDIYHAVRQADNYMYRYKNKYKAKISSL